MARAAYQTLIFPYRIKDGAIQYALFRRKDDSNWQGIAGGGEDGETPIQTAAREVMEEVGISDANLMQLASMATIPVVNISGFRWGENIFVVPEYSFGMVVADQPIEISHEHSEFEWMNYQDAIERLAWDSNRNALWELNHRLTNKKYEADENIKLIKKF